eukprot:2971387-Rhodomonas_salina.2
MCAGVRSCAKELPRMGSAGLTWRALGSGRTSWCRRSLPTSVSRSGPRPQTPDPRPCPKDPEPETRDPKDTRPLRH